MTKFHKQVFTVLTFCILLSSCAYRRTADLVLYNGVIYTVDHNFSVAEAIAIREGRILAVGSTQEICTQFVGRDSVDLKGKSVYPGFIDAHCHFYGYATDQLKCNLYYTSSYNEILNKLIEYEKTNRFSWLLGRGWDQNDWADKNFPDNISLDSLFPDKPVYLMRIDGHAALCNSAALKIAGINTETKISGGEILQSNGRLTGILIDNAVDLVKNKIPQFSDQLIEESLIRGQDSCFAQGVTTVDDAGLGKDTIFRIFQLQQKEKLKLRIYAMISDEESTLRHFFEYGPFKSDRLNVRAVKTYADGALGSRGACMKAPYSDAPGHYGFLLKPVSYYNSLAKKVADSDFQLCVHALGDSANKLILDIYADHLGGKNMRRWRIEHCQIVTKKDMKMFGENSIIPSVQPTHATSDMYWIETRLGKERMPSACAYQDLKDAAGEMIVFGTDFPVEKISPVNTFYAAVTRKDLKGFPEKGFQIENRIKKKDALRAMTTWAAYSNFEEDEKGSIEEGKFADLVILDMDILKVDEDRIPDAKVIATYVNGERVFSR
jgi:predicted amidohydrolase YtcJ